MKLLFDENLSRSLISLLADVFPDTAHVVAFGLRHTTDVEIARFASEHHYLVVTRDGDFYQLAAGQSDGPRVIWIRIGNCPTAHVEQLLRGYHQLIRRFAEDETQRVLILPYPLTE